MDVNDAIEYLRFEVDNKLIRRTIFTNQAIEVILKELDKKDKVIDEICNYIKAPYKLNICKGRRTRHIAIKQYFYKKVEEK